MPSAKNFLFMLLFALLASSPQTALAQATPPATPAPIEWRVAAVAVAKPVLAHPLLPDVTELEPGDAAPVYLTACLLSAQARAKPADGEAAPADGRAMLLPGGPHKPEVTPPAIERDDDRVVRMVWCPAAELPLDEARALVSRYRVALDRLDTAARRESCHWDVSAKSGGFTADLPHLPELAFLTNVLALDARVQALDGRNEATLRRVRTGMAMAGHLASEPTLVQADMAVYAVDVMLNAVEDLRSFDSAPNLYWSLAALPHPLIDPRAVARRERSMLELTVPGISRAAAGDVTPQQWAQMMTTLREARVLPDSAAFPQPAGAGSADLATAVATARDYVLAKRDLAKRPGFDAGALDALPIDYVIGVSQYARYRDWSDEVWSLFCLPVREAYAKLDQATESIQQSARVDGSNPFLTLVPRVEWARYVLEIRGNRRIALLQAGEALRDYAASHEGKLPRALKGVDGLLAVPDDPVTGEPFAYTVDTDGHGATLVERIPPGIPAREVVFHLTVIGR